jgi:hypothetical protein
VVACSLGYVIDNRFVVTEALDVSDVSLERLVMKRW